MKRKIFFITVLISVLALPLFCACNAKELTSLKAITHPYIAEYECTSATYGDENLLDKYEYIEIILVNKSEMDIVYKPKNEQKHIIKSTYSFDSKTKELTGEVGILGCKVRGTTKIENGKFTVTKTIAKKQLIMNFKAK